MQSLFFPYTANTAIINTPTQSSLSAVSITMWHSCAGSIKESPIYL